MIAWTPTTMTLQNLSLTPALADWLASRCDPGSAPLVVRQAGTSVEVTRADGSELSETEAAHVRGTVAAHRVELLRPMSKKSLPPLHIAR